MLLLFGGVCKHLKPIKMKKVITTFETVPAIGFMVGYDKYAGLIILIPFLSIAIKIQEINTL